MADPRTHLFANNAHCLLGEDLGAAETSLQLESGKGALFPDPGDGEIFIFTIEDLVQGVREVCYCSERSGDVLTIERGKEGTSPRDWTRSNTVIVQHRITAGTLEYLAARTGAQNVYIQLTCSDLISSLTVGSNKAYVRSPRAFQLSEVRASLLEASSSGDVIVDINKNGSTILSTKLTIDEGEKTSVTAATPPVISGPNIADDDEITIDIVSAGTDAKGLIVTLIGAPGPVSEDPPPPSGNSFQFSAGRMSGDLLQFYGYSDGTLWPEAIGEIEDGQAAFAGHEVSYLVHNRFPEPEDNSISLGLKGNPPPPDGLFSAIKITVDNNEFVLNASEASYEAFEEDAVAEWFWHVGVDIFQQSDSVLVEFIAETES